MLKSVAVFGVLALAALGASKPIAAQTRSTVSSTELESAVLARPFDEPAAPSAQDLSDAAFPPDWAQSIEVSCSS